MAADIYRTYWVFNGFAMEAPLSTIQALALRDDVSYIIEDVQIDSPKMPPAVQPNDPTSNWNVYQVRAPKVWALGYDGAGRTLANIDTGVDGNHEAPRLHWLARVIISSLLVSQGVIGAK